MCSGARAPGLDGVRALAVLAVIAFHEQFAAFRGGFLGVDVFFVLSGYLITDLLAAQWTRHRQLELRGFWLRRARRLLPALAVLVVTVTAAAAMIEPAQLGALRPALAGAVSYSSNWWQALQHQSYFGQFGPPPPLRHLWSLAIEEQFYLVWPLILIVTLRACGSRRLRAAVAVLGAALSAVAMAAIYVPGGDPSRVYYGTDTHASALFIGAALAFAWPLRQLRAAPRHQARRADAAGLAGIAVLAWAIGHYSGGDGALYPAGLLVAALSAGGLVVAAASPGVVSGLLSWAPLRWIGVRSYGIYLWHWPVIALLAAVTGPGPAAPWVWAVETAIAITLAAASWKWIEEPVLRNGLRATVRARYRAGTGSLAVARRSPARAFPAVALAAALIVACAAGYRVLRAPTSTGLEQQITQGAKISEASQAHDITSAAPRAPRAFAGTLPPTPASTPGGGVQAKIPGSKVTAIGDSVMLAAAPQLQAALKGIYIDAVIRRMKRRPRRRARARRHRQAPSRARPGARHQRDRHDGPDPPVARHDWTAPQAGARQHLRAAAVAERGQLGARRRRPPAHQYRARQLVRDHRAPHRPALGRRCASPPVRGAAVRAHSGNSGAGHPQPRPGHVTVAGHHPCHIPSRRQQLATPLVDDF